MRSRLLRRVLRRHRRRRLSLYRIQTVLNPLIAVGDPLSHVAALHVWPSKVVLMQPQVGYINDFEKSKKIVWRDISSKPTSTIVDSGVYLDATCFYIPLSDKALCSWMHSDFFVEQLKTISSSVRGDSLRWKKQWVEQMYSYPNELKKDLENIYDLSIKKPEDGIKKLNELINKFIN